MATAATMQLTVVTPSGITYQDEVEKVTLPMRDGEITVLPNHAPIVSIISSGGEMLVHKGASEPTALAIAGGILEIRPTGEVYVLADTAERAEEIDVERAEEARKRAEALLKDAQDLADVDYARIQAQIEKELSRVHVGNKYKNV